MFRFFRFFSFLCVFFCVLKKRFLRLDALSLQILRSVFLLFCVDCLWRYSSCVSLRNYSGSWILTCVSWKLKMIIDKNDMKHRNTGTLAPPLNSIHRFDNNGHPIYLPPWMSDWLNLNVMVPMIAFIVIIVGILVICIALTRRRVDMRNGPKDVYCRFTKI